MPANQYTIELSQTAEEVYLGFARDAERSRERGDSSSASMTRMRMVDEALDKIIPHDPLQPGRALSGVLSGFYRVKKGRLRICYTVDQQAEKITVVYISENLRKDGDANDPYRVLTRLVKSGKLSALAPRGADPDLQSALAALIPDPARISMTG